MAPYPLPERFTPQWYNIFGDVVKSPEYEIRNEGENLVSLYRPDLNAYVSINPARNNTSFSDGCYDWEKFCPLPYDVFMGFLYLTHPNASEVRLEETGERLPRLWFPLPSNDKLFIADFGRRRITIRDNLEAFAKVGRLQEGETVSVRFNGYMPGRVYDLTVKRLGEFTF
ncbi:hypothetical protein GS501_06475 [Saccharibacter sp. 17.LH.SD]|uniref:hypothetical protein n=1 Tax=Saccharibacter sp. 17.LH.SD TaxID=2689393 RepID=UPI0013684B95|nr:hypothetical protein [Saccharibacter sp. 17.LH.SD]MXV44687.1 hypothetical protein [Saccharibacter sp. 17.LH.SD]